MLMNKSMGQLSHIQVFQYFIQILQEVTLQLASIGQNYP